MASPTTSRESPASSALQIVTTWNPVVSPALVQAAAQPLDHPWFRPGEPPIVLGAGKLRPQKDFGTLIDAFARLRAKRPARLVILGEGTLTHSLDDPKPLGCR